MDKVGTKKEREKKNKYNEKEEARPCEPGKGNPVCIMPLWLIYSVQRHCFSTSNHINTTNARHKTTV